MGVALAVGLAGAPQGDALIQQAAVADHGRFTDHHAHAVVDEHAVADPGAGVDFNAGSQSPQLAQQPSYQGQRRQPPAPQPVAETVQGQGVQPWIAEQDLQRASRRRISLLDDCQVGQQCLEHGASLTEGPPVMHDSGVAALPPASADVAQW